MERRMRHTRPGDWSIFGETTVHVKQERIRRRAKGKLSHTDQSGEMGSEQSHERTGGMRCELKRESF